MTTLSDYIDKTRRLLHDTSGSYYTDSDLTSYINDARERVVRDTGCLRSMQTLSLVASQETYDFSALSGGKTTFDVLNATLINGNVRYPLFYMPWTQFNAELRQWTNNTSQPVALSIYGQSTFYFGPVPDQVYSVEMDTIILPTVMVNTTDTDTINAPYTTAVPFYAAYLAKFQEQSFGESGTYEEQYRKQLAAIQSSVMTRRLFTPYQDSY